jgi:hypothetical protein
MQVDPRKSDSGRDTGATAVHRAPGTVIIAVTPRRSAPKKVSAAKSPAENGGAFFFASNGCAITRLIQACIPQVGGYGLFSRMYFPGGIPKRDYPRIADGHTLRSAYSHPPRKVRCAGISAHINQNLFIFRTQDAPAHADEG